MFDVSTLPVMRVLVALLFLFPHLFSCLFELVHEWSVSLTFAMSLCIRNEKLASSDQHSLERDVGLTQLPSSASAVPDVSVETVRDQSVVPVAVSSGSVRRGRGWSSPVPTVERELSGIAIGGYASLGISLVFLVVLVLFCLCRW